MAVFQIKSRMILGLYNLNQFTMAFFIKKKDITLPEQQQKAPPQSTNNALRQLLFKGKRQEKANKGQDLTPNHDKSTIKPAVNNLDNRPPFRSVIKVDNTLKSKNLLKTNDQFNMPQKKEEKKVPQKEKQKENIKNPEKPNLDDIMSNNYDSRRKERMDRFMYQLKGREEENKAWLEFQFQELDKRDQAFVQEMRSISWVTHCQREKEKPNLRQQSQGQLKSKMKLRRQILEQIDREKQEKRVDVQVMTSLQKERKSDIYFGKSTIFNQEEVEENIKDKEIEEIKEIDKSEEKSVELQAPKEQYYVQEQNRQQNVMVGKASFMKNILMASANKLSKTKENFVELFDSAIKQIKSYSQKKQSQIEQLKMQQELKIMDPQDEKNQNRNSEKKEQDHGRVQDQEQRKVRETIHELIDQIQIQSQQLKENDKKESGEKYPDISIEPIAKNTRKAHNIFAPIPPKVIPLKKKKMPTEETSEESVTLLKHGKHSISSTNPSLFNDDSSSLQGCSKFQNKMRNKSKKPNGGIQFTFPHAKRDLSPLLTRGQRKKNKIS